MIDTDSHVDPRHAFSAPWDPVAVRRGDALGLRAFADVLADAVAPSLSNRTQDARWITVLAWCLGRSTSVWKRIGRATPRSRPEQQARYTWLRSVELMWIARTIALTPDGGRGRQVPGLRGVTRWIDSGRSESGFGMTVDQLSRYRNTGPYGAYRVAFRRWAGLTAGGDGWTPGRACGALADWLDQKLDAPPNVDFDALPQLKDTGLNDRADRWWLKIWPGYSDVKHKPKADRFTLPRPRDDFSKLPESALLEPVIFGTDSAATRRRRTAELLSASSSIDHGSLCRDVANGLANEGDARLIGLLPSFSRLADAGMNVMTAIADAIVSESAGPVVELATLRASRELRDRLDELVDAAFAWRARPGVEARHIETADLFAERLSTKDRATSLVRLLTHHERSGGGLRWFVLRDGAVVPKGVRSSADASSYRFRFWSLARLAAQCGITNGMPNALMNDGRELDGDDNPDGE